MILEVYGILEISEVPEISEKIEKQAEAEVVPSSSSVKSKFLKFS